MKCRVSIEFNPHDLWIGVFWHYYSYLTIDFDKLDVYICIVPMLPILIAFRWSTYIS